MKVFSIDFVIGRLKSGGAERVVVNLANHLSSKGHIIRIITFNDGDDYQLNPEITRIRFHDRGIVKPTLLRALYHLFKFYRKKNNRPYVISSHIGLMGFATIPNAIVWNIKVIISEHSNHLNIENKYLNKILWDFLFKYADAITILTKFDKPFFQKRNKKVIVMENPCSFRILTEPTIRKKIILAVGNLNRFDAKGFDSLLEISSSLLQQNKEWKIKIVGEGNVGLKILGQKVEELGIKKQVIFTGYRKDVNKIMQESEIFVLSSKYEGLPMALLEALSQGMACISYDCISGPSDLIVDGENGILINDQDQESMKENLEKLITDVQYRELLKSNTANSLEKFSIEKVCNKWIDLIDSL